MAWNLKGTAIVQKIHGVPSYCFLDGVKSTDDIIKHLKKHLASPYVINEVYEHSTAKATLPYPETPSITSFGVGERVNGAYNSCQIRLGYINPSKTSDDIRTDVTPSKFHCGYTEDAQDKRPAKYLNNHYANFIKTSKFKN
jgi:hypothetical protein